MNLLFFISAMKDLYHKLESYLKDSLKIVFMGIGEEKLTDDGVGPYVISELLINFKMINPFKGKFLFINAGTDPMARIEEIINFKPSHLILIDTCTLNKPPGTVAIIERGDISEYVPISSHTIPIHIVIDLLLKKIPEMGVIMIGFVPESLQGFNDLKLYGGDKINFEDLGKNVDLPFFKLNLTNKVQKAALEVIEIIKKIIKQFGN
ncbi:MAG: hydrogenase maturation protease [Candidatus Thorarchaeota archaeon]